MNKIYEENLDILGVSEVDIEDLDEKKPFTIKGFKTYFPLQRKGSNKKDCYALSRIHMKLKKE